MNEEKNNICKRNSINQIILYVLFVIIIIFNIISFTIIYTKKENMNVKLSTNEIFKNSTNSVVELKTITDGYGENYGSAASAMAVTTTTAIASKAFAVATTTAAIATLAAGISCAVSEISYSIETYNRTASYDDVIAESLIQSVVKEATKENFKDDDSMDNRVVYLGRNPEYYNISRRDRVNKEFVLHLTDSRWEYLHNKYTDSAMWIFNKAFLTYALKKEKTHNWKFRLVTEYRNYSNIIPFGKPGCFYSRELKYLRDTNHYFSSYRTYMNYGSFYQVW